ncbi:MAG: M48 family metalloprotease [Kineosporiaceae bacterium]
MTALLLGAYGFLLSRAVPARLARAHWPSRAPRAAVVVWQAVVLASGLSAVGVVLAGPEELVAARGTRGPLAVGALVAAVGLALVIVARLAVALVVLGHRTRRRRAHHLLLVDLLDRAGEDPWRSAAARVAQAAEGAGLRVLDGPTPMAYCLPGASPRVVLSGPAVEGLDPAQLSAVVAHERAHLRARHDLVLEFFTAVARAVPAPLRSEASLPAVHLLLELLADDAAARRAGARPLHEALTRLGGVGSPMGDPTPPSGPDRDPLAERELRLARLADAAPAPSRALAVAAYLAAAAVLLVPTAVVTGWLLRALGRAPW